MKESFQEIESVPPLTRPWDSRDSSILTEMPRTFTVSIKDYFNSSLERAFKTPMLCDVSKVHTGKGIMPRVTHTEDDEEWGKVGASKRVFSAKSLTFKGGESAIDTVLEREENVRWKIQVSDFKSWMLGFTRFTGYWETREIEPNKIEVVYTYELLSESPFLYPFNWLFVKLFWKGYMKQVMRNIKEMAKNKEPYFYD